MFAADKSLNLQQNITALVGGSGGYESGFFYFQDHVPTTLNLDIAGIHIPLGGLPELMSNGNNATAFSLMNSLNDIIPNDDPLAKLLFPKDFYTAKPSTATNQTTTPSATATTSQENKPSATAPTENKPTEEVKPTPSQENKPSQAPTQDAKPSETTQENKPAAESNTSASNSGSHFIFPFKV